MDMKEVIRQIRNTAIQADGLGAIKGVDFILTEKESINLIEEFLQKQWIDIEKEPMPEGKWLVQLEKEILGSKIHVCTKDKTQNGFLIVIAGQFGFDMPSIKYYQSLPEEMKGENKDENN